MRVLGIHHVTITVRDAERAARFYEDVLGFRPLPRPPMDDPGRWYDGGTVQLHIIRDERDAGGPRRHFAIEVADIDEALAELASRGITPAKGPGSRGDGARFFYIADPDGNRIELLDFPK